MTLEETKKTVIQCDFDGTITEEDVSFMMLDAYANGDWRKLLREYEEGQISVGRFNMEAFAMVKADKESLLKIVRANMKIRPGFHEMVSLCHRKGYRLVIVSNGLDFYIEEILKGVGLADIEVFAARTHFQSDSLRVQYIGPNGSILNDSFKDAYVDLFLKEDYRIIYMGNGTSDIAPAGRCHYIFATGNLLAHCQQTDLSYTAFTDFNQVVEVMESW
ncbi:MtnX-like HAD-IB family phosphatase [Chloroflexota bacterium]